MIRKSLFHLPCHTIPALLDKIHSRFAFPRKWKTLQLWGGKASDKTKTNQITITIAAKSEQAWEKCGLPLSHDFGFAKSHPRSDCNLGKVAGDSNQSHGSKHKFIFNKGLTITSMWRWHLYYLFIPGSVRIADHTMQVVHSWRQLQGGETGESSSPCWTYWNIRTQVTMIIFILHSVTTAKYSPTLVTRETKGIEVTTQRSRARGSGRELKGERSGGLRKSYLLLTQLN